MNDILINIINDDYSDTYVSFKRFCSNKEKGLRKESFKLLNSFIEEAYNWDFESKKQFLVWIFGLFDVSDNIHHVLVHQLEENLIKPILEEWMRRDLDDPRPPRWYGLYLNTDKSVELLKLAIRIGGSSEQGALLKLIDIYLNSLWYSFHHISEDLYLGETEEDLHIISQIDKLIEGIHDDNLKQKKNDANHYYKSLIDDWISFKNQNGKDFVAWCKENGKEYSWVKSYYY